MVLVVGGGTMGTGIAEVLVRAGIAVVLAEADTGSAARARERIAHGLSLDPPRYAVN